MKHFVQAALVGAVALALVPVAQASDGTITITGNVVGTTCTITGNDLGGNVKVALSPVSATQLKSAGVTAGDTPFTVTLTNCKAGSGSSADTAKGAVKMYFEAGPNVDMATGRLNVTGTNHASNVQLQLLNADGTVVKIGDASTINSVQLNSEGGASLTHVVRYYATGAVSAGAADSSLTYSVVYQ
ncbi:fimbrial protein [Frateuria defendens]|uniref:fimbrial protein n=1 Tax=Frateuria defendens TaxID=2219559 RepID=UPI00066FD609|nr:fimbrial protein [Frateuria defendens]